MSTLKKITLAVVIAAFIEMMIAFLLDPSLSTPITEVVFIAMTFVCFIGCVIFSFSDDFKKK